MYLKMQAVVIIYACIFSMPANKGQLEIYETDVSPIQFSIPFLCQMWYAK